MKTLVSTFLLIAVLLIGYSCSKKGDSGTGGGGGTTTVDCSTTNAKFATDIQPLINSSCAISGCHDGTQTPTLIDYSQISGNASKINAEVQSGRMPKTGSLSATQKKLIACWVQSGAPNN
jgi:hypothetical protein